MSRATENDHKQVEVEYDNDIVTVDEGIVELLTMVWASKMKHLIHVKIILQYMIEFDMYSFHELVQKVRLRN